MKYEAVPKRLWSTKKISPLPIPQINAIIVQNSDHGSVPIMNCCTEEDALLAINGLENRDIEVRTKPQLTDEYMGEKDFADTLMAFLNSSKGYALKNRILKNFGR